MKRYDKYKIRRRLFFSILIVGIAVLFLWRIGTFHTQRAESYICPEFEGLEFPLSSEVILSHPECSLDGIFVHSRLVPTSHIKNKSVGPYQIYVSFYSIDKRKQVLLKDVIILENNNETSIFMKAENEGWEKTFNAIFYHLYTSKQAYSLDFKSKNKVLLKVRVCILDGDIITEDTIEFEFQPKLISEWVPVV
ncbi:hypothetical protein L21SP3_02268 [Sedimentisphaera cyanobacteriorum]|uniref:Uncharacterized protein n=1 Tax=Sedimentisphaera cyanobacteriorum TaxID=1940790 RepID=A0A1Q2HT03_9BACT|nr:hypothetical protein [Sedimentisphaera cyanobacteriorum]AQQ10436.1 hypothetical protein L21SP3_02268 [Sedimentisphaera cyanobacteriorum]